jgi:hypothetical protein
MKFHDFSPFYRSGEGIRSKVSGDRLIDNPAVADAQGGSDASFSFDGTDDVINMGDVTELDGATSFTAGAWFKTSSTAANLIIVSTMMSNTGFELRVNQSSNIGKLMFTLYNGTSVGTVYNQTIVNDGQWHHAMGVWDNTTLTTYIDGVAGATGSLSGGSIQNNADKLGIGREISSTDTYWGAYDGQISQVRLHNRALSAAEVRASYNGQAVPYEYVGGSQDEQTSGTLTIGKSYRLKDWITSDDFTNVGAASNADGVEFTATGTTPTTWSNSSKVVQIGCVAEYLPSGINSTQWVDTSGNNLHGTTSTATAVNHTTGTLTLESGANLKMQDGGGIDFTNFTGATLLSLGGGTPTTNLLDDYEEGTWTPSLGSGVTTTYTEQSGHYTKVGNLVTATWALTINSIGDSPGLQIYGLPYNSKNTTYGGTPSGGNVGYQSGLAISVVSLNFYVAEAGALINTLSRTAASTNPAVNAALMQNSTRIDGSVTYQVWD